MSAYDKIARVYDPWSRGVVEDVPFYVDEAVRSGGPVLELGVGTGRIAVPIAAAGVRVVGVDLSAGMLDVARERAALAGVEIDLRHGDMRDPPIDETFPLVICPFRSLLHMETDEDRRLALRAVSARLATGHGRFVFDVFTPSAEDIAETHGRFLEREPGIWERADWDESTRTLILRAPQPRRRVGDVARMAVGGRVADAPCRGGLRGRGAVRLVRPLAVARRRRLRVGVSKGRVMRRAAEIGGTVVFAIGIFVVTTVGSLIGLNAECNSGPPVSAARRLTARRCSSRRSRSSRSWSPGADFSARRRSLQPLLLTCGAAIVFDAVADSALG